PDLKAGDLLAIRTTGAYGFVLSSNYNSRPRPCELLVDGADVHVARGRETYGPGAERIFTCSAVPHHGRLNSTDRVMREWR
ncbi:MAG TPA: hypothetical protein VHZ55_28065, partial [Bryobacteraceae bacterium]|nr:hypothetical protein [Bryobacteraceae bacterium]